MPGRRPARGGVATWGALLLILGAPSPLYAQEDTPPLSLAEALRLALLRSPAVLDADRRLEGAAARRGGAWAEFEPVFRARAARSDDRSLPSSNIDGGAGEVFTLSQQQVGVGLEQELPTRTSLGLDFQWRRTESTLGSALSPVLADGGLALWLRQPLLGGFLFDPRIALSDVLAAEVAYEEAQADAAAVHRDVTREVEDAFWGLELARASVEVQEGSMRLGELQLDLCRRRIEAGTLPPSDLIQAESALAMRDLALVESRGAAREAEDRLRILLIHDEGQWPRDFVLVPDLARDSVVEGGVHDGSPHPSPELRVARLQLEISRQGVRQRAAALLPSLDLELGLDLAGQGASHTEAADQLRAGEARGTSAALVLRWAPLMRRGWTELLEARAEERHAEQRYAAAETRERLRLDAARATLESARVRVVAALRAQEFAERSLEVEERRFRDGLTSAFFVAERQEDLARARLSALAANLNLRRAEAVLRAWWGTPAPQQSPPP